MWTTEYSEEAVVTPESVWGLWIDVPGWRTWNTDIAEIDIDGPFAKGTRITMTPFGEEAVVLTLDDVVENERFVDEARIDGLVLRTTHRIESGADGKVRVTYQLEITGEGADEAGPQIGPAITGDWPDTLRALVHAASSR